MPHPYTEADARFFLDEVVPNEADWKVSLRAAGEMVGIIGLRPQAPNTHCLGYWYGRRYWGQGYATEAARAVVDYAFGCDFVHGLASGHFQDNHASAHVLRKLGFVETGRSSRQCRFLGHDLPHVDMERPRPQP
ncbi:MAG: GNAT family N-acetyltransferase [Geminicoccaceae bacterium]